MTYVPKIQYPVTATHHISTFFLDSDYRLNVDSCSTVGDSKHYLISALWQSHLKHNLNEYWVCQPIKADTWMLTHGETPQGRFVMFGSFTECLNGAVEHCRFRHSDRIA